MHGRTPWARDLGGSESALVFAARALAARGHTVDVFTRCGEPGLYDGVVYRDIEELDAHARARDWDVFVSLRFPDLLQKDVRAALRVLWCQDVLATADVEPWLCWCDLLVFVSEWHRADTLRLHPGLAKVAEVVPNGIDLDTVAAARRSAPEEREPFLVHLSRPERGLGPLLAAWPSIRARRPDMSLAVARYRSFHEPRGSQVEAFSMSMDAAVADAPGTRLLGSLSKPALYDVLHRATAMVYPAEFDETSCIAAIEAQACGCPVVAVARGALPETLAHDAALLVAPGPDMPQRFADRVVELCWEAGLRAALGDGGRRRAARHGGDEIARRWEQLILDRLDQRVARHASAARGPGAVRAASLAAWPGLRPPLAAAVRARIGSEDATWVGDPVLGSALGLPGVPVAPFSEGPRSDVIVDLGELLTIPDRPAYLRWLSMRASRVVHLLPAAGADHPPTLGDMHAWFGDDADISTTVEASLEWGMPARAWIVSYPSGTIPAAERPEAHRRRVLRPIPTLSVCMIVRDAADTLLTTLESTLPAADEYRIVDTGSRDHTRELVRGFAERCGRPVHLAEIPWPDDFAAARNASVAEAEGDWVLWIDADERLIHGERLRRLLQSEHWEAYAIRQHNHIFDGGGTQVEIPFRAFRNHRGYRFYGAIHEHPERALNEPIEPWCVAPGVDILHYGYLTERTRRRKLLSRNLRLLNLDFEKYPGRLLTDILYLRDCVNLARFDVLDQQPIRPDHRAALEVGLRRFEDRFFGERGRYYHLGRAYYDQGLALLGQGAEITVKIGGEGGTARTHRFRRMDDVFHIAAGAAEEHRQAHGVRT